MVSLSIRRKVAMPELPEHERKFVPHIFDALRAITADAPGAYLPRDLLGEALCRWLIHENRQVPPKGATNRILSSAGYPRHGQYFRHISLRPGHWPAPHTEISK